MFIFSLTGMNWVIENHIKPAVVSMSLKTGDISYSVNDAVRRLYDAGVVVVVAAGNDQEDACSVSPASAPEVKWIVIML